MATIFLPKTPLEHAVHAADYPETLALLHTLPRDQRSRHAASARRMRKLVDEARWNSKDDTYCGWGVPPLDEHRHCAFAMTLVCGNAEDVSQSHTHDVDLVALCQEFQPDALNGLADALLASNPRRIVIVQNLLAAGLVPRPTSEDYSIGLIALPATRQFDALWQADPGLRHVLLQVMDVEGTGEFSLAAVDKYLAEPLCWSTILRRLRDEGVYSCDELMERTLAALERDWPQFRAGWFSRFHALLAPDLALLTANASRYLGLCHSRIPPTVTLALEMIKRLESTGAIDDDALLEAMQPVMHASAKGQVLAALKLLDGRVKRTPALAPHAAARAVAALAHTSAEVQGQVLQRLTQWGCDTTQLMPYVDGVAAVHANAMRALAGIAVDIVQAPASATGPTLPQGTGPVSPLDASRRLQLPTDADALVACIAHVFENDCDTDAFEIASCALVQAAPFDETLRERLGPVIKRAAKVRTPVAAELARLLLALFHSVPRPIKLQEDHRRYMPGAQYVLMDRTDAWTELALQGKQLAPLSAATHRNGWIAPALLVERVAEHARVSMKTTTQEQVRALLRLFSSADPCALSAARDLPNSPFVRALRYALGDSLVPERAHAALFAAAARIRAPGSDDPALASLLGDIGPDGAHVARHTWRAHSWTSTVYEKTYHHNGLELDVSPARRKSGSQWLAVHRHNPSSYAYRSHSFLQTPWFGGSDECMIRFSAALLPNSLETHLADGAQTIGNNLDWWGAQWGDIAYLERLLDPALPMGRMATLLLALGLGTKEPGQQAISVDALIASHREGRLDTAALAAELRALSATPLVKASRYARSLQAALRLEPALHPAVFTLLGEMVQASPEAPQKDVGLLLEMMLELQLAHGQVLSDATRAALQDMRATGKARSAAKAVLAA